MYFYSKIKYFNECLGPALGSQWGFRVSVGPACLKAWEKLRCLIQVEVKRQSASPEKSRKKKMSSRPVPRRESPWGTPEGEHRQPKAHRCNDRAEDVIQVNHPNFCFVFLFSLIFSASNPNEVAHFNSLILDFICY